MNSEEEFYDAETGEAVVCVRRETLAFADIGVSSPAVTQQGWSQMIPVRSVLRMPLCRLTAAPGRRMECGSAGKASCTEATLNHTFSV